MRNKTHVYIDESNKYYIQELKKEKIRKQKIFKDSKLLSIKAAKDLEKILGKPITDVFPYKFNPGIEKYKAMWDC